MTFYFKAAFSTEQLHQRVRSFGSCAATSWDWLEAPDSFGWFHAASTSMWKETNKVIAKARLLRHRNLSGRARWRSLVSTRITALTHRLEAEFYQGEVGEWDTYLYGAGCDQHCWRVLKNKLVGFFGIFPWISAGAPGFPFTFHRSLRFSYPKAPPPKRHCQACRSVQKGRELLELVHLEAVLGRDRGA